MSNGLLPGKCCVYQTSVSGGSLGHTEPARNKELSSAIWAGIFWPNSLWPKASLCDRWPDTFRLIGA